MNRQVLIRTQALLAAEFTPAARRGVIRRAAAKGMTLVEILVVLAIIGLIMGGVAVVASGAFSDAQVSSAKTEVAKISGFAEMYILKKKKCPKDLKALKGAGVIKKVEKDPWDNPYKIVCEGGGLKGVASAGPDGQWDNADDIESWAEDTEDEE
jgi:general secretion pathway protein G